MSFRLFALRFHFVAQGRLEFRPGQAANLVRGGLGAALRKVFCPPTCSNPGSCRRQPEEPTACPYARLFEPRANGTGPSGLADWPRPFVLRTANLEGATIAEGSSFYVGVNLFDVRSGAVAALEAAFAQWGCDGLGSERITARLAGVEGATQPLDLSLDPAPDPVSRVKLRFLTATELKGWGGPPGPRPTPPSAFASSTEPYQGVRRGRGRPPHLPALPPFELLAARIRDRVSTLRALYGEGPLPIDFREFAQRAAHVRTVSGAISEVAAQRRSRRTGQTHSLGGFLGEVEYEGDLAEFVPYLRVAAFTGVGRQTVWGKGEIVVD